jgi:hypothetical protein
VAKFTVSPSRIARYYFHECDRHLRYASTPNERRAEEGVPARSAHQSAIGKAILDGGYRWEERILDEFLAGRVITGTDGEPGAPVYETRHDAAGTVAALLGATDGQAVDQGTLRPRHSSTPCRPRRMSGCSPHVLLVVAGVVTTPVLQGAGAGQDRDVTLATDVLPPNDVAMTHTVADPAGWGLVVLVRPGVVGLDGDGHGHGQHIQAVLDEGTWFRTRHRRPDAVLVKNLEPSSFLYGHDPPPARLTNPRRAFEARSRSWPSSYRPGATVTAEFPPANTFGLPAFASCPGATPACSAIPGD